MSTATELNDWLNGVPTGGPNGDGRYPLTYADGVTYLVYCPAAQALNPALSEEPIEVFSNTASNAAATATAEATEAQQAATAAQTSAANAAASATAANNSKVAAQTAATNADASATTAETAASAAFNSETESANWAAAASTSAANAGTAKTTAETARDKANSFANADQGVQVEAGLYSAKHWSLQAQAALTGTLMYKGTWNAGTAYPTSPSTGHFYKVAVAGNFTGVQYDIGDQIVYNGASWDKIDNTEAVLSVAGRTGNVILAKTDVGLGNVDNTSDANKPVSTAAQTALNAKLDNGYLQNRSTSDANTATSEGVVANYLAGAASNKPAGTDHALLSLNWSNAWSFQFAGDWRTGDLYIRGNNNGTWSAWRTVWHSGNFDPATKAGLLAPVFLNNITVGASQGVGYTHINNGNSTNTGWVGFYTSTGVRKGYFGYADTATLTIAAEDGTYVNFINATPRIAGSPILSSGDATETATGSKLVMRTASGWIYCVHINVSGPTNTTRPTNVVMEIGDGFLRRQPLANFRQNIGLWVQAADPGAAAVDGDLWIW